RLVVGMTQFSLTLPTPCLPSLFHRSSPPLIHTTCKLEWVSSVAAAFFCFSFRLPSALQLPVPVEHARHRFLLSHCSYEQLACVQLLEECSTDGDCRAGLYCFSCPSGFSGSRCVRSTVTDQFKIVVLLLFSSFVAPLLQNNSLPFNKYAYLTTHNAFAIDGEPSHTGVPRITITNQEDTVTQQLNVVLRIFILHEVVVVV
ncbi:hypothetical protein BHE74_00029943, partial [Ensete ventricosum]